MTALFIIKFGSDQIKNWRRVGVLKYQAQYGPALTTISKCHKIFDIYGIAKKATPTRQSPKQKFQSAIKYLTFVGSPKKYNFIFPITTLFIINVSDLMKTGGVMF